MKIKICSGTTPPSIHTEVLVPKMVFLTPYEKYLWSVDLSCNNCRISVNWEVNKRATDSKEVCRTYPMSVTSWCWLHNLQRSISETHLVQISASMSIRCQTLLSAMLICAIYLGGDVPDIIWSSFLLPLISAFWILKYRLFHSKQSVWKIWIC